MRNRHRLVGSELQEAKRSVFNMFPTPHSSSKTNLGYPVERGEGARLNFGPNLIPEKRASLGRTGGITVYSRDGRKEAHIKTNPNINTFLASPPHNKAFDVLTKGDAQALIKFAGDMSRADYNVGRDTDDILNRLRSSKGSPARSRKDDPARDSSPPRVRRRRASRGPISTERIQPRRSRASSQPPIRESVRAGAGRADGRARTPIVPTHLDVKTGQFGNLDIDLPALSKLGLIARKGDRVVMKRKHIDKDLLKMLLGKKIDHPSQKAIDDFHILLKHSGVKVGEGHSSNKGSKATVDRLKLLIGHIKSGGNNRSVKAEVSQLANLLQRQGHLTPTDHSTILREYGR